MVLFGYVALGTIEVHFHGVNHIIIQCCSELHWPPLSIRRDYLSLITIHDILHKRSCFDFYSIFSSLLHILDLIPFLYIVNSQTSIHIGIPFLLTVYFYGTTYIIQLCLYLIAVLLRSSCIAF